jgi:circadian clock protein KaiB
MNFYINETMALYPYYIITDKHDILGKEHHKLILYIAGKIQQSNKAIENIGKYCEEHLKDSYTLEIIDLKEHPQLAEGEQIIATPTLIKKLPDPIKILVTIS